MRIKRPIMQPPQPKPPEEKPIQKYGSITAERIAQWQKTQALMTKAKEAQFSSPLAELENMVEEKEAQQMQGKMVFINPKDLKNIQNLQSLEDLEETKGAEEVEEGEEEEVSTAGGTLKKIKKKRVGKKHYYQPGVGYRIDEIG